MTLAIWPPCQVVDGVITWQCLSRPDAVTIEHGAYSAWRGVDLPDGGQTWERAGSWRTARLAMEELDRLARSGSDR